MNRYEAGTWLQGLCGMRALAGVRTAARFPVSQAMAGRRSRSGRRCRRAARSCRWPEGRSTHRSLRSSRRSIRPRHAPRPRPAATRALRRALASRRRRCAGARPTSCISSTLRRRSKSRVEGERTSNSTFGSRASNPSRSKGPQSTPRSGRRSWSIRVRTLPSAVNGRQSVPRSRFVRAAMMRR